MDNVTGITFESTFNAKMKALHEGLIEKCEPGFFPWLDQNRERQWSITVENFEQGMAEAIRKRDVRGLNTTISTYRTSMLNLINQYQNSQYPEGA